MIQYSPNTFLPNKPVVVSVVNNTGMAVSSEVYQINPKHRDDSPRKSQWIIGNREEVGVFGWALEHNSQDGKYYWGVYLQEQVSSALGRTVNGLNSRIARFESSEQPKIWHGYPVDYIKDPQHDCPHRTILTEWAKLRIITKAQIAKLIGGQGWKE